MLARTILVIAVITAIVSALLAAAAMSRADEPGAQKPAPTPPDALAFTMNRIDGTPEDLSN